MIGLDRTTFRRLVWLYIASGVVSLGATLPQFLLPSWREFSTQFDILVLSTCGESEPSDAVLIAAVAVFTLGLIWHIASIVGLLSFRPWARSGLWASLVLLLALVIAVFGFVPSYSTPLDDLLGALDSALFGALVLLAYAKDHGAKWFARPASDTEE